MARVVILSFKENAAAEAVVAKLDALQVADSATGWQHTDLGVILAAHAKPEALLARPTAGCKCRRSGRVQGWTRTERFGWFVCPECKRPSQTVVNRWIRNLIGTVGSNNLLQELRDKITEPREVEQPAEEPGNYAEDAAIAAYVHPDFLVEGTITGRLPAPEVQGDVDYNTGRSSQDDWK
jgi:hypothetical protein